MFANYLAHLEQPSRNGSTAHNIAAPEYETPKIDTSKNSPLAAHLITELQKASNDTESPRRMELAVAEVFRFLGFHTQHLGKSGEGDVLISANLGSRSYKIIADAKSRQDGKLKTLDGDTLEGHRQKENAEYSLVVAQSFSGGGKIIDTANRYGIILMTINCLIRWIEFHDVIGPLGLDTYRLMFERPGIRHDITPQFNQIIEARSHYSKLLRDVMDTIHEAYQHGLTRSLSAAQIQPMLIMRQRGTVFYTEDEIQQALDLLAYPGIQGILDDNSMQIDLVINRQSLSKILIVVANQIG